jgi:Protein of unknown function (DUF2742)
MSERKRRPERIGTAPTDGQVLDNHSSPASRTVDWWSVRTYVEPLLSRVGYWPMIGTVDWCALDDDDPAKLAAIYDAAQHHALRVDTAQAALAEASHDVAAGADWPAIASDIVQRRAAYIPRRAS